MHVDLASATQQTAIPAFLSASASGLSPGTGSPGDFAAAMQAAKAPVNSAPAVPSAPGVSSSAIYEESAPFALIDAPKRTDGMPVAGAPLSMVAQKTGGGLAEAALAGTGSGAVAAMMHAAPAVCNAAVAGTAGCDALVSVTSPIVPSPVAPSKDGPVQQFDQNLAQPLQAPAEKNPPEPSTANSQAASQAGFNSSAAGDEIDADGAKALSQAQADPKGPTSAVQHGRAARGPSHRARAMTAQPALDGLPAEQAITAAATATPVIDAVNLPQAGAVAAAIAPGATLTNSRDLSTVNAAGTSPAKAATAVACTNMGGSTAVIAGEQKTPADPLPAMEVQGLSAGAGKAHAAAAGATDDDGALPLPGVRASAEQTCHLAGQMTSMPAPADGVSFSQSMGGSGAAAIHAASTHSALTHADVLSAVEGSRLTDTGSAAQAYTQSVRRLDVAINDPSLGVINVRAEVRAGALHASLAGVPETMLNVAPALHQFLQENQVSIHTLRLSQGPEASARNVTSTPTISQPGMLFGGDRGSTPQQQAHTPPRRSTGGRHHSQDEAWRSVVPPSSLPLNYILGGSFHDGSFIATVSIHI